MYYVSIQSHVPVPPVLTWESDCKWEFRRLLPFQRRSYQPQPLLQRTKEFFQQEEPLVGDRIWARYSFVRIFKSREFRLNPTESKLLKLLHCLDTFFFSSLLTRGQDPIVRFNFGDDIFEQFEKFREGQSITWGRTRSEGNIWDYRMQIKVEASEPSPWEGCLVRRSSMDVVQTLVHEMAHAYLFLFSCPCWSCRMEIGPTGHGAVWQELKQAMCMEIRTWDPSLRDFYINYHDNLDPTYETFPNHLSSW